MAARRAPSRRARRTRACTWSPWARARRWWTSTAAAARGAKRDDLQAAMALIRKDLADHPLSFNNFRD
jgi:hypothetical protein